MKKVKEWKFESDRNEHSKLFKSQRERIVNAINSAKISRRWSYDAVGDSMSQHQWNQTLISKIFIVNAEFGGHAIICSSEISVILEDSIIFFQDSSLLNSSGFNFIGMLDSLKLYVDSYLPSRILLLIKNDFFTSTNPECAVIYVDGI